MFRILIGWAINAACLLALPYLLPAVQISNVTTALIAALVLGLLNVLIRPILVVLTLPISVITLGLFILVINGLMFWLAARFLDGFAVSSFGWAIVAALVYSLISWAVSALLKPSGKA
jgi:putative membrane protein